MSRGKPRLYAKVKAERHHGKETYRLSKTPDCSRQGHSCASGRAGAGTGTGQPHGVPQTVQRPHFRGRTRSTDPSGSHPRFTPPRGRWELKWSGSLCGAGSSTRLDGSETVPTTVKITTAHRNSGERWETRTKNEKVRKEYREVAQSGRSTAIHPAGSGSASA